MSKIFFLGDSITAGAWDEGGGWANRLIGRIMRKTMAAGFLEGGFYCLPYNLGVSGDTVPDLLARAAQEIGARMDQDDTPASVQIVCAIGTNDSQVVTSGNETQITIDAFAQSLERLCDLAKKLSNRVSLIGLIPVDESLTDPCPWAPDCSYTNARLKVFEDAIGRVSSLKGLAFLPLFERWDAMGDYSRYLLDGLHPNGAGHGLLADQVGDFLLDEGFFRFHRASAG